MTRRRGPTNAGISAWPLIRRKERSASSMLAAIHRFFMVPFFQYFTRPMVSRAMEIIDSMQFVFVMLALSRLGTPRRATVNISSRPSQGGGGVGMVALELGGEVPTGSQPGGGVRL